MVTIDSILDDIAELDDVSREMLLEILQKRHIEYRRDEIAKNGKQGLRHYQSGKLEALNAEEVLEKLNKF